jgi:2-dehydropantoate 2-reductase
MRIAIVGLGGVGGYLAASLVKTSHKVAGFARGEHLAKIQTSGLKIVEDEKEWQVNLCAKSLQEADGYFDIVIFCVKSYDLEESCKAIASHIDSNSILISFSNGVSNADLLRELSDAKVLEGCIYILSHIQQAGVICKKGDVFAAVFGGDKDAVQKLSSVFDEANLRYKIPSDIKAAVWKKYIFISAFATLTTYYDANIRDVYENRYNEAKALLREIAEVAQTKGVDIYDEIENSLQTAGKVPYDSSTSMHLDFKNRKRDELETLSGYIVKEAKRNNIEVPFMKKMYLELQKRRIS